MKKYKKLIKHFFVPHKGNSYRPHALRHKALSLYSFGLILSHLVFGVTLYSGPVIQDTRAVEENIITHTNIQRRATGSPELFENQYLRLSAQQKLQDMFVKNYWDHVGPEGETAWDFIEGNKYQYYLVGENLARGFGSSEETVEAWMASPTHKANILNNRFKEIGVAVGNGKIHGQETTVIVQLFGEPKIAVAGEKREQVAGTQKIMPELSASMATAPARAPFWAAWLAIFVLVIIDGVMIRKLGLHCSKSHIFNFRVSLLMSAVGLLILMLGFVAII